MVKQGIDFRSEADDFYARYERATDREEIGRLYQRTNNRDIKSQLSWAMAAAFTVTGLRLILSPGPDSGPTPGSHLSALPKLPGGLELTSRVAPQRLAVGFRRSFF